MYQRRRPLLCWGFNAERARFFSNEASVASAKGAGKLLIGFTCKVCNMRSHRTMSKQSYQRGIVLVECGGCKSRHVIADHLGWFEQRGEAKTVEEMLAARGETIKTKWEKDEQGAIMECLGVDEAIIQS